METSTKIKLLTDLSEITGMIQDTMTHDFMVSVTVPKPQWKSH